MQFVRVKRGEQIVRGYFDGEKLILDNGEKILQSEAQFHPHN